MKIFYCFLISCLVGISVNCQLWANEASQSFSENIDKIENLFRLDRETLPATTVIDTANQILEQRIYYSADITAKVFILLAQTAINRGDINKALQFAQDGLTVVGINDNLKVQLLLQLSFVNYSEGRIQLVLNYAQQAVKLAKQIEQVRYQLIAMSYSAMSNALLAKQKIAFEQLQQVEQLLVSHEQFNEHIDVIEILALAHLYLRDYEVASALYNKAIKLRYDSDRVAGINRSYYYLALVNLEQKRLDDAYSGFYEAKQQASTHDLTIRVAYANLGLGRVLLEQAAADDAILLLNEAREVFQQENLSSPFLSTLVRLAQAFVLKDELDKAKNVLVTAESHMKQVVIAKEHIPLFQLLAQMYRRYHNYEKALGYTEQYLNLYQRFYPALTSHHRNEVGLTQVENNQQLALNLAVQSDLRQSYFERYQKLKYIIFGLSLVLVILVAYLIWISFKQRSLRLNRDYDEVEKPLDYLASSNQSKKLYHYHFKMARRYQYPISIGYLLVNNWEELCFRFNKKTVNEVKSIIATLINEITDEFEQVGLLHDGEYIILAPHQMPEHIEMKLKRLSNNLTTRFFANLGDFSVKMSFSVDCPNVQDIDPYIFLSRLSESTRSDSANFLQ